jgi:hypothetical protein
MPFKVAGLLRLFAKDVTLMGVRVQAIVRFYITFL